MRTDLEKLTTDTAIKVSSFIVKIGKNRKARKDLTEEDIKKYDELHALVWALSDMTSAIEILSPYECPEDLLNNVRSCAVMACEKINELI